MAAELSTIQRLPVDILLLIIPYLSVQDFSHFLQTSKEFYYDDEIRYSPSYWKYITRSTYRVPIQPIVVSDGKRWMNLYRKVHSESRLYSWGQFNGEDVEGVEAPIVHLIIPGRRRPRMQGRMHSGWPRPIKQDTLSHVGKIVDLQAGGWSTVFLSAKGSVFVNGQILGNIPPYHYTQQRVVGAPKRLEFPAGYNPFSEASPPGYYDPHTAIGQFSAGRAHILGLTDAGGIWTWNDAYLHGLNVRFLNIESNGQTLGSRRVGQVTKVLAGWNMSSAYVHGIGIVLWEPADNLRVLNGASSTADRAATDTVLVMDTHILPLTDHIRTPKNNASDIGEVVNWVLLEHFIVFVTDIGKAYFSKMPSSGQTADKPLQLNIALDGAGSARIADVQGSFRSFGLLLKDGQVLTGDEDLLNALTPNQTVPFRKIPSLQHTGVISLAFGDYHFHALHADGTISSHGREPSYQGALGLGENGAEALRGIVRQDTDGQLHEHCESSGRKVQFEEEKRQWLEHLSVSGLSSEEARQRADLFRDRSEVRAQVSEWVEQRLRNWSTDEDATSKGETAQLDYENLPPYFALSVAAAGWHSGALVLVNEEKAAALRAQQRVTRKKAIVSDASQTPSEEQDVDFQTGLPTTNPGSVSASTPAPGEEAESSDAEEAWVWQDEAFPRLKLKDGTEMPGSVPLAEWTCPEWKTVELVDVGAVPVAVNS